MSKLNVSTQKHIMHTQFPTKVKQAIKVIKSELGVSLIGSFTSLAWEVDVVTPVCKSDVEYDTASNILNTFLQEHFSKGTLVYID